MKLIACSKNTALSPIFLTKCNTNLVTRKHEPDANGGAQYEVIGLKAWKVSGNESQGKAEELGHREGH